MTLLSALVLSAALQGAQEAPELRVVVEPAGIELAVDGTAQLTATVSDASGAALNDATVRWLAVTSDIVSVDGNGTVTALRPGEGRVAAVVAGGGGNVVGFATVLVPQLPAASLTVDAPTREVAAGGSVPLHVQGENRLGDALGAVDVRFRSSDEGVAVVDAAGRVYGVGAGRATITAMSGEATADIDITVGGALGALALTSPSETLRTGDVFRFAVTSDGAPVYPEWAVSGAGASIEADGSDGVFVAEEPGRYRVTAVLGQSTVQTAMVEVEARTSGSRLVQVGRGPIADHHSGDMWVFEGVDGRDYVYVGTFMHDWMKVFDVTDASAPFLTDSIQLDARRINDVKIHANNRLGIVTREGASSRRNGIVLLDLTTPAHPTILSEYTETVTGGVHNVWIEGDIVYAAHNGTSDIHILDISEPTEVREVGRWGLDKGNKTLHDVIIQDGYAFLSYWDDGVVILDVGAATHGGTPTEPTFVSRYAYPIGNTHVAWRSGQYLFLGDEIFPDDWDADRPIEARGYIHVVDVSDIDNPHEVAFYRVPEAGAHNVWVEDDKLYVGYYQAGLRVVDISGELRGDLYAQGRELAAIKTTDADTTVPNWSMTWGAQIFKGRIYTSDLNSGIWIARLDERAVVF